MNLFRKTRIQELDGVRGIAILLVLSFNGFANFFEPDSQASPLALMADHIFEIGWIGVTLFFVLSGYLIGRILLRNRDADNYYSVFFLRRSFRILPVYFIVLSPLFLIPLIGLDKLFPQIAEDLLAGKISSVWYALFLQNIAMTWQGTWGERWTAVTWSLAVEQQFYVLAPFLVRYVPFRALPKALFWIICSAPVLRTAFLIWLPRVHADAACYTLLPSRWDALAMGMLIAWTQIQVPRGRSEQNAIKNVALASLVFALAFSLFFPDPFSLAMASIGHTIVAIGCASFVWLAVNKQSFPMKWLAHPFLGWIGLVSYGVYLMHSLTISFTFKILYGKERSIESWEDLGIMAFGILLGFACASCSWYIMEKQLITFSHRFQYKIPPEP